VPAMAAEISGTLAVYKSKTQASGSGVSFTAPQRDNAFLHTGLWLAVVLIGLIQEGRELDSQRQFIS